MMKSLTRIVAGGTLAMTAMLVAFYTSPASALSDEDWDTCARSAELSSDRPIRGCTAIISAGERLLAQLVAAYNNRGLAFRANGDLDRAIEDYDQAIRLMPDHHVAINNRGVALMAKGELDRAITDFDHAIRLKSDYFAAFGSRAAAYSRKGLFDRAIADLDVVIKADPKNQILIRERATMKAKMGDAVGADVDFCRAEALAGGTIAPTRPR
ncbi:tetratricopeptide repeat protein [Bradyrhizobium manausense]|nr:tetratricopeptide repeat protein [Bradyrhizobium manausense]